jgi:hypothetical protein
VLYGVLSSGPPLKVIGAAELQMQNELWVLVLGNLARLNKMALEEKSLPGLLGDRLLRRCEQGNQVPIPYDRDSPGRVQVFRTGPILQGLISPQELHIGLADALS